MSIAATEPPQPEPTPTEAIERLDPPYAIDPNADPDGMRRQIANLEKSERKMLDELSGDLTPQRRMEGEFVLAGIQRATRAVRAQLAALGAL